MISGSEITHYFGSQKVLSEITFSVDKGSNFVLAGTSGSGKTTLLKMLNRLITPTSGRIEVDGMDTTKSDPVKLRRNIGYIIQETGLFPHMNVLENILTVPRLLGVPKKIATERGRDLLEQLKLSPGVFEKKFPEELSGGEAQRVGVARALCGNPDIILMDEPFGALDPITRNSVRNDFINLESLKHKTLVLVTHDIEEAFLMADQVMVLHQGEMKQQGDHKNLILNPTPFVKDFLRGSSFDLALNHLRLKDFKEFFLPTEEELPVMEGDLGLKKFLQNYPELKRFRIELDREESVVADFEKIIQVISGNNFSPS